MNLPLIYIVSKAAKGEIREPHSSNGKMPLWEKIAFVVIAVLVVTAIVVALVCE